MNLNHILKLKAFEILNLKCSKLNSLKLKVYEINQFLIKSLQFFKIK